MIFWINILTIMSHRILSRALIILILSSIALPSCGGSKTGSSNQPVAAPSSPLPSPKTGFEADLDYVRKGQYTYVWVISRKDGQLLDRNDSAYLRTNAPQVVDWVTSEGGKKVIAGTNFDLAQGNLALLQKRFNVEDYSGK